VAEAALSRLTGSQTHVVRGKGSSVGRLAMVNLVASIGQLLGPVLAGVVASRSIAWPW
jgi:hypothetical protein